MIQNAWLIPLLPLAAFVILLLGGRQLKQAAPVIAIASVAGAFVLSSVVLMERIGGDTFAATVRWLTIGPVDVTMGFEVTALNSLMLFVVTAVSLLVHIFSKRYMAEDGRIHVFYGYLTFFTFSMLGLVLAPNLLQLFIFWELVGLCSFLLVGFWYFKKEAADAAKKAFLVTRIGDVGLLVGLVLLFNATGSFEYGAAFAAVEAGEVSGTMVTVIALCIFLGAVGKSAQFPLHVWLPDAMEGPTPVSALIHAATMVAAGVYLVAVTYPLFLASGTALTVVAYTGAITAVFAASIALVNTDIKRVLAYSTVSQLGLMMLALGTAGYVAGLFHLMTHAFFKALLFLAAGSVILALHHRQDITRMGGLWHRMRTTAVTFLIGTLAIAGIFPLAGFWSKEAVLAAVWANGDVVLITLAALTTVLTAFYMFRLFFRVFAGTYRGDVEAPAENGKTVTVPLIVLAVFAVTAGFVHFPLNGYWLEGFMTAGLNYGDQAHGGLGLAAVSLLLAAAGAGLAWRLYGKGEESGMQEKVPAVHHLLENKYYIDEIYAAVIVRPLMTLSRLFVEVDRWIIDGAVNFTGAITFRTGRQAGKQHNGQLQTYGLVSVAGGIALIAAVFAVRGYFG
ncbi:NADH-quinone oxidoreductase subunit L [Alteribacter natronophilus]|uniref:NADH-quinone oxidoreductase subunit L n=1 Tax=Alteribacter natronophilus TaxID=2583810 RepID=UPI00110DB0F4|nr:NADH-quinone oxidoreductase subunit L [Alteribacter natronophilus]TMW72180.1 NADH-quinone oxidoreductase subunit L [Alteribacter natronophilus]